MEISPPELKNKAAEGKHLIDVLKQRDSEELKSSRPSASILLGDILGGY